MLSRRHRADLCDVDLAGDHVVTEPGDDLGEQLEPVAALVSDQHPQALRLVFAGRLYGRGNSFHPGQL